MTAYEKFFENLKQELDKPDLYPIWPEFTAEYDADEYAFVSLPGLGGILMLNCGVCDGPSDLRHATCRSCAAARQAKAEARAPSQRAQSLTLCRFFKLSGGNSSSQE